MQLPSESKEGETEEKQRNLGEMKVQSRLKEKMSDKGDKFEEMVEHEEHIAFGEDGWKERYYRVRTFILFSAFQIFYWPRCTVWC